LCDLARYYQLPVFSFGGCSDSKCFDQQAAVEGTLWIMTTALAGGNLSHDTGYIDSGLTSSMEMTVMSDEVIGMVRRFMGGLAVNDETMALDVIDQVGPGGNFIGEQHTLRHFRENWVPVVIDRQNFTNWASTGSLTYGERANARAKRLLSEHQPRLLTEDKRQAVTRIVARADARCGLKVAQAAPF
jgi:trimethylamine--corrinoid protein Co-methyltransferase